MRFFVLPQMLAFVLLSSLLTFFSCNKDQDDEPRPIEFSDFRDYAAGEYDYTITWTDLSTGEEVAIDDLEVITGTALVSKVPGTIASFVLEEDGEEFITFEDAREGIEGFTFNHSWVQMAYEGDVYSFFAYDKFMLDGEEEAGVYNKATQELNFAWFVEIENADLVLTFRGKKRQ